MSAYILRAKPHGKDRENDFLAGQISIGWPCGQSFLGKNRDELAKILSTAYPEVSETSISMVDLFVKMPSGSIILTPSIQDKSLIHIFKTLSTCKYSPSADNDEVGNPHFIEAEYLKTVPRINLPEAVVSSLSGARKTLSRISQHFERLDDFIDANFNVEAELPSELHSNKAEALQVLYELLNSQDENIRLQAAIAIIKLE